MNSMKSAIYYSQWMVFDLEKYNKRDEIDINEDGFLYVLEDGYSSSAINEINKSKQLLNDRYFASFNEKLDSPSFKESRRHRALKENSEKTNSIDQLKQVMQYNQQLIPSSDYLDSSSDEQKAIESGVYNSVAYRLDEVTKEGGGGVTDIKVTNSDMIPNNECYARCGPVLS